MTVKGWEVHVEAMEEVPWGTRHATKQMPSISGDAVLHWVAQQPQDRARGRRTELQDREYNSSQSRESPSVAMPERVQDTHSGNMVGTEQALRTLPGIVNTNIRKLKPMSNGDNQVEVKGGPDASL